MNKKVFPIIILIFAIAFFGYQIQKNSNFVSSEIVSSTITSNQQVIIQNNAPIYYDDISVNQLNISAQPKVWFYVNLVVVLLTPTIFIIQGILDKTRAKKNNPNPKPDVQETKTDESIKEATRIESAEPKKNSFFDFIKYGFLVLFIQNILILILLVAVLATIPQAISGNEQAMKTMTQIYSIVFNIDFLTAILSVIGLILTSKELTYKIQTYVAMGFWIIWIPLGIAPRIRTINAFGIFTDITYIEFGEFAANFYGRDLFLMTLGTISFSIALFYTANVLFKNQHIKGKGIITSFAITNYVIMSGFSLILLYLLSYGSQLTGPAIGSLLIVWGIFFFAKLIVSPVIGIIAGIQAFKQIK